ncbi:hypothetical protein [Streptomyces sp. NPDC091215]|uniref:hypothetical protein n=1 Tax=Streptomyces sp. NPDC091215 TaxID=3155192 RepID=UPI003441096E
MQSDGAQSVVAELMSLARDDEARLSAAKDRLARAQEELTDAQSAYDSASVRAEVSQRVAGGAQELLPGDTAGADYNGADQSATDAPTSAGGSSPGPGRTRPTLAGEILGFVRGQGRAVRRAEIAEHLRRNRPDLKPTGLGPELTERVRAGMLARTGPGMYDLPARVGEGGDEQQTP